MRRYGYVEFPKPLVDRARTSDLDLLDKLIGDALAGAEMNADDTFYLRLSVIELLPEDEEARARGERWPT